MIVCRIFQTILNKKFYTHKIQITLILLERFECNKHTRTRNNSFWFLSYLCVCSYSLASDAFHGKLSQQLKYNKTQWQQKRKQKYLEKEQEKWNEKKNTTLNHVMKNLCIRFHIFLYRFYFILKYFIRIYYYMFPLRQKWTLN